MIADIEHDEAMVLLEAALDDELDAITAMRVEAHIKTCPECAREYGRLSDLSSTIREFATHHDAPEALRSDLIRQLTGVSADEPSAPVAPAPAPSLTLLQGGAAKSEIRAGPRHWFRPATSGFVLGAALAASIAVVVNTHGVEDMATDGVVGAHIRALQQPSHLTDVQVSDQHQVKPWFDGKIDLAPPVKDLTAQGFDLVGGRLDYLQGHEAAVVVYRRHLHVIDLFVTRATDNGTSTVTARSAPNGYNAQHWNHDGLEYWAVSDLNQAELSEFAEAWRK